MAAVLSESVLDQNGPKWPYSELDFSIRETKMDQNGPFWSREVRQPYSGHSWNFHNVRAIRANRLKSAIRNLLVLRNARSKKGGSVQEPSGDARESLNRFARIGPSKGWTATPELWGIGCQGWTGVGLSTPESVTRGRFGSSCPCWGRAAASGHSWLADQKLDKVVQGRQARIKHTMWSKKLKSVSVTVIFLISRPGPCSVGFGRETPKFRFEFCRGLFGEFFPDIFPRIH